MAHTFTILDLCVQAPEKVRLLGEIKVAYLAVSRTEAISPPSVTPEKGVMPSPKFSWRQVATNLPIRGALMISFLMKVVKYLYGSLLHVHNV